MNRILILRASIPHYYPRVIPLIEMNGISVYQLNADSAYEVERGDCCPNHTMLGYQTLIQNAPLYRELHLLMRA